VNITIKTARIQAIFRYCSHSPRNILFFLVQIPSSGVLEFSKNYGTLNHSKEWHTFIRFSKETIELYKILKKLFLNKHYSLYLSI
jgi:hypothetical protein